MKLDGFVVAGTGSRTLKNNPQAPEILERLGLYVEGVRERHPDLILMSGGAEGWDEFITLVAQHYNIPYVMCIPNKGYLDYYWRRKSVTGRNRSHEAKIMLNRASQVEYTAEDVYHTSALNINGVHMNFVRNQRMVDLADAFLVYGPTSAGTSDCLSRIKKAQKPWKEIK